MAPGKTQLECEKHKRLVTELKKRRSEGESGLVIKNGEIKLMLGVAQFLKEKVMMNYV